MRLRLSFSGGAAQAQLRCSQAAAIVVACLRSPQRRAFARAQRSPSERAPFAAPSQHATRARAVAPVNRGRQRATLHPLIVYGTGDTTLISLFFWFCASGAFFRLPWSRSRGGFAVVLPDAVPALRSFSRTIGDAHRSDRARHAIHLPGSAAARLAASLPRCLGGSGVTAPRCSDYISPGFGAWAVTPTVSPVLYCPRRRSGGKMPPVWRCVLI